VEEFLAHGYETYIIDDDYTCPLRNKVETIIENFPDSILFFNIDATVDGVDNWKVYISEICKKHAENALIGVLHAKGNPKSDELLRQHYEETIGVRCGFISLQAHHHENFDVMIKVLEKHGALGRRQLVRANMDAQSHFNFEYEGKKFKSRVMDVNISHFACVFPQELDDMKIYDKVRAASFRLNGMKFNSDAVLLMKRTKNEVHLCIFMFITQPDDKPELPPDLRKALNRKIYQVVADETLSKLKKAFKKADK
ncbi:MAG: hypothetical protein IJS09_00355, partial [Treponema sp.]|nr:hypothetical protein [Treponema sp.]